MFNFPISYLNSNDGSGLLAFGDGDTLKYKKGAAFPALEAFVEKHKGQFIFGYLGYDLKNETEILSSKNIDRLEFPDVHFWVPKYVVELKNEDLIFLQGEKCSESFDFLNFFMEEETDQNFHPHHFDFKPRIDKQTYLKCVAKLQEHIQQGDIYEVNFCQEFFAENVELNFVFDTYFKLNMLTKAPFSSFLQFDDFSAFCGSPERFLQKKGDVLRSEPIKGTSKRGKTDEEDEQLKNNLQNDAKERSENIMVVDLVRNDLSKIAIKDSVKVEELCALYSFKTVHQLISTITCTVEEKTSFTDIIKATFPMGSMTGVPKIKAMQIIEEFESFKRGLYSGSIGYIMPNGDFDFNVVIRSLLYNKKEKYLSCSVGGAITSLSSAQEEYKECLVKVKRILDGMNE